MTLGFGRKYSVFPATMRAGDLLLALNDGDFRVWKVLRMTPPEDQARTAHVLLYQSFAARPTLEDVERAEVAAWHAPIDAAAMERDCEVIGNRPVTGDELSGYREYLKHADFRAYLVEAGLSAEEVIAHAQCAYDQGNRLSDAREFEQAIAAYERAIDRFPAFYEAHDNRALALMDLARYREAAEGFEESLRIQPDNRLAFFSRGECFLRMGEYQQAVAVFEACISRWPQEVYHHRFLKQAQALAAGKPPATRPWWRLW